MAKRQTRRSLSMPAELNAELVAFSDRHGIPMSQVAAAGIRAVLDGLVRVEHVDPHDLGMVTEVARGNMSLEQAAARAERIATNAPPALDRAAIDRIAAARELLRSARAARPHRSPTVALPLTSPTYDDVQAAAERQRLPACDVLDAACLRMLDEFERHPGSWCRACLQALEHCECSESTSAQSRRTVAG